MKQHRARVIATGAGVGEHVELQRRQLTVVVGAGLDGDAHRMPRRGRDELFFAGQFKFYRASGLERSKRQNIFDEHFLLATKTAADARAKYPDFFRGEIKDL